MELADLIRQMIEEQRTTNQLLQALVEALSEEEDQEHPVTDMDGNPICP